MSCYIVQETDGVSRFTLEDGTGFLLLEFCPPSGGGTPDDGGHSEYARRRRRRELMDEEEWLSIVLGEM